MVSVAPLTPDAQTSGPGGSGITDFELAPCGESSGTEQASPLQTHLSVTAQFFAAARTNVNFYLSLCNCASQRREMALPGRGRGGGPGIDPHLKPSAKQALRSGLGSGWKRVEAPLVD